MTPDRREELRRCDDASVRTRYELDRAKHLATIDAQERIIQHFQSHVVTDNSKTLANALERINALESLLAELSGEFVSEIGNYWERSKSTVNYHNELLDRVSAILPSTEKYIPQTKLSPEYE